MNNREWFERRAEMHNYMPTMIAFKRKRSGWRRSMENIVVWVVIFAYALAAIGFIVFSALKWGRLAVLVFLAELFVTWHAGNKLHEFLYDDDSGLHNLEGYDPETGTVPDLEAKGFDTSKFWYKKPPSKR
jgi:hypothetical protein